jgi:hypothetical protein
LFHQWSHKATASQLTERHMMSAIDSADTAIPIATDTASDIAAGFE